jgi:peptidoglycan/xylan/chitin deacetylase (PgdA/CDA1 family)
MNKAWYILNYHDISWEDTLLTRGIDGSFPPDVFRDHIKYLSNNFRFVSIQEGVELLRNNKIIEPIVSFWFDDGYRGTRKYALPILNELNIKAAISINSRFFLHEEMFWRCILSYLHFKDGDRFIRSYFRNKEIKIDDSLKKLSMDNFSIDFVRFIGKKYNEITSEYFRKDAFRIFDNVEGIKKYKENKWIIANHSSAHYPIGEDSYIHELKNSFLECESAINDNLQIETDFWVIPFERKAKRSKILFDVFKNINCNKTLVLGGDSANTEYTGVLNRIGIPNTNGPGLIKRLSRI